MAKEKTKKGEEEQEIKDLVKGMQSEFGNESICEGIEDGEIKPCEAISTRCLSLDLALGVRGVPRGRVIEIYGPESSGKTTVGLTIIAEAQAMGLYAALLDVEHGCDPVYMRNLGCNLKRLLFSQPDNAEQALNMITKMTASGKIGLIVLDSVAALVPKAELEGEVGDHHIGAQARLMSQTLRKLVGIASKTNTTVIFINQIREKVGMIMPGMSNEVMPGGRALKFYSSVRMDIRRVGSIATSTKDKEKIGNETRVKIVKNKVAPPFREAKFQIMFGKGISYIADVLDLGIIHGVIEKSGPWLAHGGSRLGQGKQPAVEALESNSEWFKKIESQVRDVIFNKPKEGTVTTQEATEASDDSVESAEEEVVET
jgi:recombination protein RecA